MIALVAGALAHPGADEVLRASGPELAAEPCHADRWLDLARAFGSDRRTDEALGAVARAEACGATPGTLAAARGVLLAEAGRDEDALEALDRALEADPDHAGLRLSRSRVLARLGLPSQAIADAERGLARVAHPQPDDVLGLARLYRAAGDPDRALATLDRVPPSPALVEEAVAIELALGRPEGALGRVEAMPPTPHWLVRAAELRGTP